MKKLLALLLLLCGIANAANFCVGPTATGNGSGSDWSNQMAWGTFTPARGTGNTYFLQDGSGTYPAKTFSTAVSGTTIITIKKATVADHGPDGGWNNAMGDGQSVLAAGCTFSTGFWTLDGNRGGTGPWDACNPGQFGFLVNVGNGQEGISCPNFPPNLSFINIDMNGPGYHATTSETNAIRMAYTPDNPINNTLISRCRFQNIDTMLKLSHLVNGIIEYCTFQFCSSADMGAVHPDTMFMTICDGVVVRYCFFGDVDSESIFYAYGGTNQTYYGNVMVMGTGQASSCIELKQDVPDWGVFKLYNNTFVGWSKGVLYQAAAAAGSETKNNLFDNCANSTAGATSTFNGYRGTGVVGTNATSNSVDPFVDRAAKNYRLKPGSWPINAGSAMAAPYNQDMDGTARGTGGWDLGAYEFAATGPDVTQPTVFSAAIVPAGNQITLTFSEPVQFGSGGSAGWTLNMSGGASVLSSASGVGSNAITFNLSRVINSGETGTLSYVQPGNGCQDLAPTPNALASFPPPTVNVTNNSTQGATSTPQITLAAGPYFGTQTTTITDADTASGAVIHYTIDGSTPTGTSPTYSAPLSISTNQMINAIATWTGHLNSGMASSAYEVLSWASQGVNWKTFSVGQKTSTFTWSFSVTAPAAGSNAVVGLGPSAVSAYTGMACIVQFLSDTINAVAGGAYTTGPAYTPGAVYNFVATINVTAHTWTVTVTPAAGGATTTIVTNAQFRTEQLSAAQLSWVGIQAASGAITVSNMTFPSGASSARYIGLRGVPASGGAVP